MFSPTSLIRFFFLVAAAAAFIASSVGAPITWGSPGNISGDQDVSTAGTLVAAFNTHGVLTQTVNGVFFQAFLVDGPSATAGNFSFTTSPLTPFSTYLTGDETPPFTDLSASYQALLRYATFVRSPATFTFTMSGLSVGTTYQFQWWDNSAGEAAFNQTIATAGNSVTLVWNTANGLGQFATGTFVADAPTQTIDFSSPQFASQMNAFQLRVIPEPSTWALLGMGALFLVGLHRRQQRPERLERAGQQDGDVRCRGGCPHPQRANNCA